MKKLFQVLFLINIFITGHVFAAQEFTDKKNIPHWGNQSADYLLSQGIIKGNDDGTLRPYSPINRAEFAKLIITATQTPLKSSTHSNFLDVETSDWFSVYVETAFSQDWLSGYPDGTFRPGKAINRAEVAKILINAFGIKTPQIDINSQWFSVYFKALEAQDLLPYGTSLSDINAATYPSRIEVFEQVYRILESQGKIKAISLVKIEDNSAITGVSDFIADVISDVIPVAENPGKLYVSKNKLEKINTTRGQKNIEVHSLNLSAKENLVKISTINFRRVGNGRVQDFKNLRLNVDNEDVSVSLTPNNDIFTLHLTSPLDLPANTEKNIKLFTDISLTANINTSSRFVLFLPDWIGDDSKSKIGFFPFGGRDVIIK